MFQASLPSTSGPAFLLPGWKALRQISGTDTFLSLVPASDLQGKPLAVRLSEVAGDTVMGVPPSRNVFSFYWASPELTADTGLG